MTACQALVQWLHARGQRWVPIVDPGIKIDPGYPAYDAGLALGVFITSADDGEPYVGQAGPICLAVAGFSLYMCEFAFVYVLTGCALQPQLCFMYLPVLQGIEFCMALLR